MSISQTLHQEAVAAQRHIAAIDSTVLALSARHPGMARAYQILAQSRASCSAVPAAVRALGSGPAGVNSAIAALAGA